MITANTPPTYLDILKANDVIKPFASRTPVLTSQQVNDRAQAQLFFKCEHFQKVGAFKFRGGCHAVMLSLLEEDAQRSVIASLFNFFYLQYVSNMNGM
jgi:threonine dehydratase